MTIASSGPVGHIVHGDKDIQIWSARMESGDGDQVAIRGDMFEDDVLRLSKAIHDGGPVTAKVGAVTVEFTPTEYKRGDFSRPTVGSFAMVPVAPVEIKGERVAEVPLRRSCSSCGSQRLDSKILHAPSSEFGLPVGRRVGLTVSYADGRPGDLRAEVCRDCGRVELFMEIGEKEDRDGD